MTVALQRRAGLRRRDFNFGLGLALGAGLGQAADAFPSKPIRWVVGFPPGGGTDVLARTVGAQIGEQVKQSINVENRPGAGGMLAAEHVAASPADGYTVLTGDVAILVFNPVLYPKVRYDPLEDFTPVGLMARFPVIIATHPRSGFTSMEQVLSAAQKGDTSLSYGSAGIGTPHHLAMELLLSKAAVHMAHVPYRGDAPALQDLAAAQLPLAMLAPSLSLPYLRSGRLRALAISADRRLRHLPDVPTLKELGLAQAGVYAWQGMVLPKKAPPAVVARLGQELQVALAAPEVRQKLAELGMEVVPSDGSAMAVHIRSEKALWEPLIKARGIQGA